MADGGAPSGPSLATVMFTDVVGSTALRSRIGETAADELRRAHDRLVAETVSSHGGRLVKGLGDGAMATFGSPSEATGAAIAVQRGVLRLNRRRAAPAVLEVRVGLSLGEVTWEDGDCFGTAVIEASRLCAAAGGGEILVGELVRLLAGDRVGAVFTSVGALELKGLTSPVTAYEVSWRARSDDAPLPLPGALRTEDRLPFVSREAELGRLEVAWKDAAVGERRQAVFVAGEPGIGKTRLVSELARHAHDEGAHDLHAPCDEDVGIPYQPFVEALDTYVAGCPADQLRMLLGPLTGDLRRLVPTLVERVPGLAEPLRAEPETERYRLFEAVVDLLASVTAATPSLLVLDDLHWADRETLLLLRHLLRAEEPMRLLVVATYRDTDIDHTHPLAQLLTDAHRGGFGQRLALSGLDLDGVAALVAAAAQHELGGQAAAFARELHAETDGNAFFVEEVLRHLIETGSLVRRDGRWSPRIPEALGIPEGVRDVVGQRLVRLPGDAAEVLAAAAVIGQEFDVDLLAGVVDSGLDGVVAALGPAEAARLIAPAPDRPGRYRFSHALVLSTLYDGLATTRRRWLHRAVGLALEKRHDRDQRLSELAHHFDEAAPLGEAERAVAYAREAAERASASLAFERAAAYYERALAVLERSPSTDRALRCELLLALGESLECAGDERFRQILFSAAEAARALDDDERLARAALLFVHFGAVGAMIDPEVLALMEGALERLGPGDSAARAGLLAGLATGLLSGYPQERRVVMTREAVAMARRLGDTEVLARVLGTQHMVTTGPDTVDEGLPIAREVVALAEALDLPDVACRGYAALYTSLVAAGDIGAADAALDAAEQLAGELRQPFHAWWTLRLRAAQALFAGRGDEAEELADRALARSRETGFPEHVIEALYAGQLHLVRQHQGRVAELLELRPYEDEAVPMWAVRITWAVALCEAGRPEEARALLDRLSATDFADLPRDLLWFEEMVSLSTVAHLVGDRDASAKLYRLLEPYAGRNTWGGNGSHGPVDRALGILAATLGRLDDAEAHLTAAIEQCERMRAAGWATRARGDLAAVLAARDRPGDADRSHALAVAVVAEAEGLGMAGVAERARALLG